jgi:hypothetical protein
MSIASRCARRALVTLATIALVVTGASIASASAKTSPTVTIGVIAPIDGGLTDFGRGIRDSVLLAVKQASARSTVIGASRSTRSKARHRSGWRKPANSPVAPGPSRSLPFGVFEWRVRASLRRQNG